MPLHRIAKNKYTFQSSNLKIFRITYAYGDSSIRFSELSGSDLIGDDGNAINSWKNIGNKDARH